MNKTYGFYGDLRPPPVIELIVEDSISPSEERRIRPATVLG